MPVPSVVPDTPKMQEWYQRAKEAELLVLDCKVCDEGWETTGCDLTSHDQVPTSLHREAMAHFRSTAHQDGKHNGHSPYLFVCTVHDEYCVLEIGH